MLTILKEVVQGDQQIRTIDHGDRKLIFQSNNTKDIIFALVVKEDLIVFHRKLKALIEEFDKNYKDLVKNIHQTSCNMSNWRNLESLILKYFFIEKLNT